MSINSGAASPPNGLPPWRFLPTSNSLAMGVRGRVFHRQVQAFVGNTSPSPMQRIGASPMMATGFLPPDKNDAVAGLGSSVPAADSWQLLQPILTMSGLSVTTLATSARRS